MFRCDLRAVLPFALAELNDPRLYQPMRPLPTRAAHDPALADTYRERLDGPEDGRS